MNYEVYQLSDRDKQFYGAYLRRTRRASLKNHVICYSLTRTPQIATIVYNYSKASILVRACSIMICC